MTTTPTPPRGYRWLRRGEKLRKGDKCKRLHGGRLVQAHAKSLAAYGNGGSGVPGPIMFFNGASGGYVRPLPKRKGRAKK